MGVSADNSARLVESRPLLPRPSGGDEIADLDAVLHGMAGALGEAAKKERAIEEMKQQFADMISPELRTPLTSIQAVLRLLSIGTLGRLPEKVSKLAFQLDKVFTTRRKDSHILPERARRWSSCSYGAG